MTKKHPDLSYRRIAHAFLFTAVFVSAITAPLRGGGKPMPPADISVQLWRIDSVFKARNYSETERLLKSSLKDDPDNAEYLWRYSNLLINAGDVAEEKEPYYRRSVEFAEAAVKADPQNANAHAFVAASYGSVAMFVGGEEKVKLARKIRAALDKSLALDPDNVYAHTIYGTYHRTVSDVGWVERQLANVFLGGLPDASFAESVSHLKTAIRKDPDMLRHRFELGLTYIAMGKEDLAIAEFRRALKCPITLKADTNRKQFMREYIEDNG